MAIFTTEQLDAKARNTFTTEELDQMEDSRRALANVDPQVFAKKTTSQILGRELGIDSTVINTTYNSVVRNIYGEELKPLAVQKRMQDDGILANPQADNEDIKILAHSVITNTSPPEKLIDKRMRQNLVKQTARVFSQLRKEEEDLFISSTDWAKAVKEKIDDPDTIYAMPVYTDEDLLNIDT